LLVSLSFLFSLGKEKKRTSCAHITSAFGYLRSSLHTRSKGNGASCSTRTIATSDVLPARSLSAASS